MDKADLEQVISTGAEHWRTLKAAQYGLRYPAGVYASDLPMCVLLAQMPGTDEEIVARAQAAAELLGRLRADARTAQLLPFGGDGAAVLALAGMLRGVDIPVPEVPAPAAVEAVPDAPPTECPNCAALQAKLDAVPADATPAETAPVAEPVVGCEHVGSDGKCPDCTGDRMVECADCQTSIVAAKGRACRITDEDDCGRIYCADCASNNLNEHGYCGDCAQQSCDACNDNFERDTLRRCANVHCEHQDDGLCEECAGRLYGEDGKCATCAGAEDFDCDGCDLSHIETRLTKCAGEDCEFRVCDACKTDLFNERGYCEDCRTVDCSDCGDAVDRGTEKRCTGKDCGESGYCEACADRLLTVQGLCGDCADEDEEDCSDCGATCIASRLTECRKAEDCGNAYCTGCAPNNLDVGRCPDCRND